MTTATLRLNPSVAGGALIISAATCYGLMPLFATQAHRAGLDAPTAMAGRFLLAAAGLWLVVALRRPARPHWTVVTRILVFGAFCWPVQAIGYMVAVTRLGASVATLLIYTYPLLVVIIAVATGRQRLHRSLLVAGGLVFAGVAAVFGVGAGASGLEAAGIAAGVISAATYAGFILGSEPLSQSIDPFLFTTLALTGAAVTTGIMTALRGGVETRSLADGAVAIAGLAIISTVVAATTFLLGLQKIGAATASVLSCTEVVVSFTVAALVLGERLTAIQVTGCAAIVGAAIMLTTRRK